MATTDYGTKYRCFQCGTKFYDLHRPEPICPSCKANQKDAPPPSEATKGARETLPTADEIEDLEPADLDFPPDDEELGGLDEDAVPEDDEEGETEVY